MTSVITGLAGRTQRCTDVDLLAWAGDDGILLCRDGTGLAGRGVAMEIALPGGLADTDAAARVQEALAAIDVDDELGRPGCGAVALGALPFDSSVPATLVVPAELVGRASDGTCWHTVIGDRPARAPVVATERSPDGFSLTARPGHDRWQVLVRRAVDAIAHGDMAKVVLAREVLVETNRPIVVHEVLARLAALYPSCTVFAVDGFIGASPELLVSRRGRAVRSHPLAGTIAHRGDPDADRRAAAALLASAKDRDEHRHVVDAVKAGLAQHCEAIDAPDAPAIVTLRNVSHLGTMVRGTLGERAPSALELVRTLHPTPAVAGTPTDAALRWVAANEDLERGRYAGPVGWVDSRGDGEWVVGIRCAEVAGTTARLFAGVGIVADSDPDAELAETQLKLQALLSALVRP